LYRLDDKSLGYAFTRGTAWDLWVFHLRGILKEAGLPVEIRRDDLGVSDFVYFIDEIQNQLPTDLKVLIRKRSLEALATAMKRALDAFAGWTDVPIEMMVKLSLGAVKAIDHGEKKIAFVTMPDRAKRIDELLERANRTS
jgi:hypothetical protein